MLSAWISLMASESLEDIKSALKVLAKNRTEALQIFDEEYKKFLTSIEKESIISLLKCIRSVSKRLSQIELKSPLDKAKIITLVGEVYVRKEEFSRLDLIETLEKNDFIVLPVPVSEFIYYCNELAKHYGMRKSIQKKDKLKYMLQTLSKKELRS